MIKPLKSFPLCASGQFTWLHPKDQDLHMLREWDVSECFGIYARFWDAKDSR